jgi:hypothetical protein
MFSDSFVNARPPARLEVGRVIGLGFAAVGRDWPTLALLGTVFYGLPSVGRGYAALWLTAHPGEADLAIWTLVLATIQQLTLLPVLGAAVAWRVHQRDGGRRPSMAATAAATGTVLLWLLGAYFSYFILILAGLVLLVAPGIIAAVTFGMAVPACVVERLGVRASLTRSLALSRGQRSRIFIIQIVLGLILAVFNIFTVFAINLAAGLLPSTLEAVSIWSEGMSSAISAVLGAVVTASLYLELRAIKEGSAAQDVAQVFA